MTKTAEQFISKIFTQYSIKQYHIERKKDGIEVRFLEGPEMSLAEFDEMVKRIEEEYPGIEYIF